MEIADDLIRTANLCCHKLKVVQTSSNQLRNRIVDVFLQFWANFHCH